MWPSSIHLLNFWKYFWNLSIYWGRPPYFTHLPNLTITANTRISGKSQGFALGIFQIHSKGLCKHPNDSRNHLEWLFWLCETCLRHIRNHPTTENYFLRLHFRKLPPENEQNVFGLLWLYKGNYYLFKLRNEEFRCLQSEYMTIIIS